MVPLWVKSNFSFLEGASHPEELVAQAAKLGMAAMALTDRDGFYGIVRAYTKAQELGLKLIYGAQVSVDDGSEIVLLVRNHDGYRRLCHLLSIGRQRAPKGSSLVTWDEIVAHANGLTALWGGARSLLVQGQAPEQTARVLREAFGPHLYAMLARHRHGPEYRQEQRLLQHAQTLGLPLVAAVETLYHHRERRDLQDVLTCIRHGVSLTTAGTLLKPNAEHRLLSKDELQRLYTDQPEALLRTDQVAEDCHFCLSQLRYRYPSESLPNGMSTAKWLRKLTLKGACDKYDGLPPRAMRRQIRKELALINDLEYCGYFLTMYEIVDFCNQQNILCQGRGSAANSIVCYCLGITAIDPIEMNLLFERFISRERHEPPDIDLDIEHQRREEVIQHVYNKYGRDHAAMVANVISYRRKSAIRDVGKAMGLSSDILEQWSNPDPHKPLATDAQGTASRRHFDRLAKIILGFPRHLSIHPGGFLLGHEPVHHLVPIENATMDNRTVIQWDKDDVETLGLFKVDLLGLGALTHLHKAFDMLKAHYNEERGLRTIPADDEDTYDMICRSETVGVFQIESRAQMSMLPRMRPRKYYDLVIEISIVRPGPIVGGMVHPFLRRRRGEEKEEYPLDLLEPILEKTLGIPIFQEQAMQLAIVAAGYTPGEADQLRRDMASWRKSGKMESHEKRLKTGMLERGISEDFAHRVYEQLKGFGSYGFPESHAASFALIAYAGSWLRCHYLDVFVASLLNSLPMGFYPASIIIDDAKRHGLQVRPIDVCQSEWDCTLERHERGHNHPHDSAVRIGFRYVKGFSEAHYDRIAAARCQRPFSSTQDLIRRSGLDRSHATALVEAGACDVFAQNRRQTLWSAYGESFDHKPALALQETEDQPYFSELDEFEHIRWDYQATGLSTHGHPMAPMRPFLNKRKLPTAAEIAEMAHGDHTKYAGLVICRQRPGTGKGVMFMTLEDETGFVNLVVWKRVQEKYNALACTNPFLGITGTIQSAEGVVHLVAQKLWAPDLDKSPTPSKSRNFH